MMMNQGKSYRLGRLLLALLALAVLTGLPVLAQADAPEQPEPPAESPAPPAPGEPLDPDDPPGTEEDAPDDTADDADDSASGDRTTRADITAPPAVIAGSRMIDVPVEAGMREFGESAWVRVLNLSPNAGDVDFSFVPTAADATAPATPEFMRAVGYEGHGTYVEVPAGNYELNLASMPEANRSFDVSSGRFYTVVLLGLELPPEAQAEATDESGGFMGWLRGLFGGDDGGDAYTLDVLVLEDDLYQNNLESESLVRVVNAAPGTEAVTLAVTGESGTLTGNAAYGAATGTNRVDAAEFSGPLELRLAGSRAAVIPLEDMQFAPGTVNTVFLVGTPIESAPLQALVLSTPSFGDDF